MFLEAGGHASWPLDERQFAVALLFGLADAALDVADGFQIFAELDAIAAADPPLQPRDPIAHRIEDAPIGGDLRDASRAVGAAAAAEHPLEDNPRVVFH